MFHRNLSVAVLGAGHGGLALAGYLAQQGHRVALWNRSAARIAPVAELGGIRLTQPGSARVWPTGAAEGVQLLAVEWSGLSILGFCLVSHNQI